MFFRLNYPCNADKFINCEGDSMHLKTVKTIKPGDPGSKKWIREYGDNLICVRYKQDPVKRKKHTTIELIARTRDLTRET